MFGDRASRDEWTGPLKCPRCGKTGEAIYSDDSRPFAAGSGFNIESVTRGFAPWAVGTSPENSQIACIGCDTVANIAFWPVAVQPALPKPSDSLARERTMSRSRGQGFHVNNTGANFAH
jgi:hypothetical protein